MEVILMERIEKLGQMGDIVTVKTGYARNFLLPQNKAMRATAENRRSFEEKKAQLEASNLVRRNDAEAVGKKLDGVTVILIRQAGDAGQLYGSVNARDIAEKVTEAGFTVDRRQIRLEHPIKSLGLFTVRVDLHPEISVPVAVNIARSEDEALTQAKTGKAIVGQDEVEETQAAETGDAAPEIAELLDEGVEVPQDLAEIPEKDPAKVAAGGIPAEEGATGGGKEG